MPPASPQSSCIFEHVYFARPDSRIFGRWVQESRDQMGRQLARESGVPADVVVPVPDSGVTAALGYAEEAGIPFRLGLIRNHYVGRTFIEPEQRVRDFGVRLKLNPVRNLLEGKRVVLIDDSIIRGTTSRKIVRMVRGAGAKEVHLRISCPPTISPCFYGVDTPSKRDLIAANNSIEEIRRFIEADSLAYLSLDGLLAVLPGRRRAHRLLHRLLHRQLPHAVGRCGRDSAGGGWLVAAAGTQSCFFQGHRPVCLASEDAFLHMRCAFDGIDRRPAQDSVSLRGFSDLLFLPAISNSADPHHVGYRTGTTWPFLPSA